MKITSREKNYSQWYLDVISAADLGEHSPVKGCMVIKPYGYAIWERIQQILDEKIKATGVKNAYFPLFIPQSYLHREADHVEGFSPECAVVTEAGGKKLEEPLVVRPTSETIMYEMYSKWINSYRDLPLLINQWANVVRWEMRPRLFLRTTEFLWQEGHTAHSSLEEAQDRTMEMLDIYKTFVEEYLSLPVIAGRKSEAEKFAGAVHTYCIEGLMQDGKSLQAGTSHLLGQNFAKVFDVKFLDTNNKEQYVWQTSWGVSTRLIGALIMAHSDDRGLVLPPKLAPIHVVIVPIFKSEEERDLVVPKAAKLQDILREQNIKVELDLRDIRPGNKFFEWEKKGVPIRVELGPRDIEQKTLMIARRDTNEKESIREDAAVKHIPPLLEEIQENLFVLALERREKNSRRADSWDEFAALINEGGYVYAHWCGEKTCEAKMKALVKAVSRCMPLNGQEEDGEHSCILCKKKVPEKIRWVFASAY